jgi:hypothetical protein
VDELDSDRPEIREAAVREIMKAGMQPDTQAAVIGLLRAAATHTDPEVRERARQILKSLNRSEGEIEAGGGHVTTSVDGKQTLDLEFRFRVFADGSAEMEGEFNGRAELFSASSWSELAHELNEAARGRGFDRSQFDMREDGSWKIGGASSAVPNPELHVVRSWGIWVTRQTRGKPGWVGPRAAWDGWLIQARTLYGRGFQNDLQLGDVILSVDGKKAGSLDELRTLLERAGTITLLDRGEKTIRARPGE